MWRCISDKGADFLCSVQAIASLSGARSLSAVPPDPIATAELAAAAAELADHELTMELPATYAWNRMERRYSLQDNSLAEQQRLQVFQKLLGERVAPMLIQIVSLEAHA